MTTHWNPPLEMDEALSWANRPNPSPATRAARAALEAQAKKTAAVIEAAVIEARARRFALDPSLLDMLDQDLLRKTLKPISKLTPRQMRQRIAELIGEEIATPRPLQIGGNVPMINLKAAMAYADRLVEIAREAKRRKEIGAT